MEEGERGRVRGRGGIDREIGGKWRRGDGCIGKVR